ncbi:MAG: LysR family transcriptional regulator [Hyphomicrobiales bacterium]|nr:LysR family transcriptional regulator [Hyphomicrobiales bacterium]
MESDLLLAQGELGEGEIEMSGDVRIGAPDGFSTYWLAGALADFLARHPGVRLQLSPMPLAPALARREIDVAIVLEKPDAGRFVARKLTDYSLGIYGAADYLAREGAPADAAGLARHRLVGYVGDLAYSPALGYVRELFGGAPTRLECASAVTQVEAVRAGAGLGVVHDFIARRFPDLVRVLPARAATRTYWILTHEDTRGIGRIRAAHDALVDKVREDRATFVAAP